MLHIFKKNLARLKQPLVKNVPNGEYADLRQRLYSIKLALKYTLSMLNSSNRIWILQIQQQRQFSERFHEAYPSTLDDTYAVAKQFAHESQALYDTFTRENISNVAAASAATPTTTNTATNYNTNNSNLSNTAATNPNIQANPMAVYAHIIRQIRAYVGEIEGVETLYSSLSATKAEAARYQKKLDAMERSTSMTIPSNGLNKFRRPVDEARRVRNLQKLDTVRDEYRRRLKDTVDAQKNAYKKYPVVFKAALTAYWLSHEKHVTALVHSLEKTQKFANKYESEMGQLDVKNLSEDDIKRMSVIDPCLLDEHLNNDGNNLSSPSPNRPTAIHMSATEAAAPKIADDITVRDGIASQETRQNVTEADNEPEAESDNALYVDAKSSILNSSPDSVAGVARTVTWSPVSGAASTVSASPQNAKQEQSPKAENITKIPELEQKLSQS